MTKKSGATLVLLPNELILQILDDVSLNMLLTLRRTCKILKACSEELLGKKAQQLLDMLPELPLVPTPFTSLQARQIIAEYAVYNKNYDTWNNNNNHFESLMYDAFISMESFISNVERQPNSIWSTDFKTNLHGLLTKPETFAFRSEQLSKRDISEFDSIFQSFIYLIDRRSRVRLPREKLHLLTTMMELAYYYNKCWDEHRKTLLYSRFAKRCLVVCK